MKLNFLGILVLSLAWLLPNHYLPWVNFHSESLTFLGLAALCFATIKRTSVGFPAPAVATCALALAAVPWVQYASGLGFYSGDAFMSSFYVAGFAAAISIGSAQGASRESIDSIPWLLPAQVLLTAAVISALLAFLQWLSLTDGISTFVATTDIGDRAMANLGQPNQLGTLLLMGLGALVLMFELFNISYLLLVLGSLVINWGIVLTESRTAMLSALAMATFLAFKAHARVLSGQPLRLCLRDILLWAISFILALQALHWINAALLLDRGRSTSLLNSNGRVAIWMQSLYAIKESPWVGYGWNQTSAAQATGALFYPGDLAFTNAHNLVLDLMAWVGVPFGLAITGGFAYWLYIRARAVKSTGAIYAVVLLIPVLVHSMFEFPFAYAYFLVMVGFLIGIIESDYPSKMSITVPKRVAVVGLTVITVIGIYAAYEYLLIEEDYRIARFENLKVGRTEEGYVPPPIFMHTQMAALLTALRQPAVRQMDDVQLERLRQVSIRFGLRPLVFRYALALGLNGEPVAAAKQMLVFRGMFGERAYQGFKLELRGMQAAQYPELAAIQLP